MRFMSIPPFPRKIEIPNFEFFLRGRLSQKVVYWPEQAIPLVGYMGWPTDPEARAASVSIVRGSPPLSRRVSSAVHGVDGLYHPPAGHRGRAMGMFLRHRRGAHSGDVFEGPITTLSDLRRASYRSFAADSYASDCGR